MTLFGPALTSYILSYLLKAIRFQNRHEILTKDLDINVIPPQKKIMEFFKDSPGFCHQNAFELIVSIQYLVFFKSNMNNFWLEIHLYVKISYLKK